MAPKKLLFVIERGGYPLFTDELAQMGFAVAIEGSVRKALTRLKSEAPDIILAEFNYGPRYGMQISNLEPLLAQVEIAQPGARVIAFADKEYAHHLETLRARFRIFETLIYPLQQTQLVASIQRAANALSG